VSVTSPITSACWCSSSIRVSRADTFPILDGRFRGPRASSAILKLRAVEHAFGRGEPFKVGVEEELLLVDPRTYALKHHASELLAKLGDRVKPDVYEAEIETASPVCATAAEAAASLGETRGALREAGATLIGAGIHPSAAFGDVEHVRGERYEAIAAAMRGLMRRTPTCALHVHVGMPDPEAAIRAYNGLRAFLPVLQGLGAHSPFWHGIDSGFATARAQMFRALPSAVIPPELAGWDEYVASVETWGAPDYTHLWWDLRPHPHLGTVELRAMDAQARLGSVAALAALVHGLAIASAHGVGAPAAPGLVMDSFRAGRDGLEAAIWWRGIQTPLREVAREAVAIAAEHAPQDDGIERILRDGNGADRMRAAYAAGGMPGVLSRLVEETLGVGGD
jgi:glutamate---cysteine ligase / carboxylate-amine ligase